jgi:prepilin-type N-terminal cleavage/methylation domain-containing protein
MQAKRYMARRNRQRGPAASRGGFTLVEILMVVTAMAIIAGVVVPQVTTAIDDARHSATLRDLRELTLAIERYRMEHNGGAPDRIQGGVLIQLTQKTDADGNVGTGPQFIYGPYAREMPTNALNGINRVFRINSAPPANLSNRAGWVYHPASGQVWAGLHAEAVSLAAVQAEGNL